LTDDALAAVEEVRVRIQESDER